MDAIVSLLPKWLVGVAVSRMHSVNAVLPIVCVLSHFVIYKIVQRWATALPRVPDRIIWTGISIGTTVSWVYLFWDVLPLGRIEPALLINIASGNGDHIISLAFSLFNFLVVMWPYHVITGLTSESANVQFVIRKTIPLVAIGITVYQHAMIQPPLPSVMIRLVSWILSFMMVDALVDVVSIRNAFVLVRGDIGTFSTVIKACGLAAWIWFFYVESEGTFPNAKLFRLAGFLIGIASELNPFVI
jgi:hypothetical protein